MAVSTKKRTHGPGLLYVLAALVVVAVAGGKFLGFAPPGAGLSPRPQPANPPAGQSPAVERIVPSPTAMTEVLVYHTHTTENYMPKDPHSRRGPGDVVEVGKELVRSLDAEGIGSVHILTVHDLPEWGGALDAARRSVQQELGRHDGIRMVLDIHRDALPEGQPPGHATSVVDGVETARVLFVVGSVDNSLAQQNVGFARRLHEKLESIAPGVSRGVRVLQQRTNGDVDAHHVTVYVGDYRDTTVDEAVAAGRLLGRAVAELLREDG